MKNEKSIGYWVLIIGFWLLVSHLPNSAAAIVRKSRGLLTEDSIGGQKKPQSTFIISPDPNSNIKRQLWQADISINKGRKDTVAKDELERMIEQIRSIKLNAEEEKETFEHVIVPEMIPIDDPDETLPDTKKQEKKRVELKLPYEPITDQTLQILKNLSQHPGNLRNPFELGEILFLSGNLKEAVIFYKEALKKKSSDDAGLARDRAWILFQMGNCLRNDDPPTARKMYGQLITEHPNSLWKELADARNKLLDWYQKDEPRKLIAERKTESRRQKTEP